MRISYKLIIPYSIILVSLIGLTSYFMIYYVDSAVTESEINKMKNTLLTKQHEVQILHDSASSDLVFALKNPLFVKYFELPETKAGNKYQDSVLQFTERQREIKNELEQWIYHFQNKFQVDETCLIDTTGQEHTRLVLSRIESDENLSPDEETTPFFEPSFEKNRDDVHLQYPYISSDTNRWVFAYTSPVVLGDETKSAIYHFEMPITIFQDLMNIENGRMYVIDPQGLIIADSDYDFSDEPLSLLEHFPSVNENFQSTDIIKLAKDSISKHNGFGTYTKNGETHYVVFSSLPYFDWIIAYEKPHSSLLAGNTSLSELFLIIMVVSVGASIVGILAITTASFRITRPIISLKEATNQIEHGIANVQTNIDSTDELGELGRSFNKMSIALEKSKKEFQEKIKLKIELDELKKSDKLKDDFLAMLSHELRTPLIPIQSYTEMLLGGHLGDITEKQKDRLTQIKSNCDSLLHLISELLFAQKLELNEVKINKKNVDLRITIEKAIQTLKSVSEEKKIKIITKCPNITISHDSERIVQTLTNLINNSLTSINHDTGIIEIFVEDLGSELKLSVKDNGGGIPKDKQENIFKKFFQVNTALTREEGGIGLGLAICKGIVELHGGRIWLDSIEGNGTTVFFTIPKIGFS